MAKAKSFLERIQPARQRWKMVEWPFPVDGEETFKVKVRVLGQFECEAAYLATVDHFKDRKRAVPANDSAFAARERIEQVFRAYSADGEPLAVDVEELAQQPLEVLDELYATWMQFQKDVASPVPSAKVMDELVEHLKKNMDAGLLSALPSSWLTALITSMAAQLSSSMQDSSSG